MSDPLTPNTVGYALRKLEETIQRQQAEINVLRSAPINNNTAFDKLASALAAQSARIEEMTRAIAHKGVAQGEDIPGPRLPRWYTVSIALAEGSTATASGEAIITNDGPFQCFGITAYYLPSSDTTISGTTSSTFTNRFLPVSTAQLLYGAAGSSATDTSATAISNALLQATPDLSFKIEVAGSGRSWTPNVTDVPGGVFFGPAGYNRLQTPALVASGERIVVTTKPERAMRNTGTCRVIFEGYQVLTNQPVRY